MGTHKQLKIWNDGISLVTKIYSLTNSFPESEKYCLVTQMRRASISIPSNITEGAARKNDKEYIQFLYIALGSATELDTQLIISKNLGYIQDEQFQPEIEQLIKSIISFIKYLKAKQKQ
jgi:four helix bundle protein